MAPGSDHVEYQWQFPAGRTPSAWSIVEVSGIHRKSRGLFGIGRSPSIAGNLPDAHTIAGTAIAGENSGTAVSLDLPGPEANRIGSSAHVALGVVDDGVVICLQPVPSDVAPADRLAWAEETGCPSP